VLGQCWDRPTIALEVRKRRAELFSERGEDTLIPAKSQGARKGTRLQEEEC